MEYGIEKIKEDVRIAIDENAQSEAFIDNADEDTLTLNQIIESKIEEAARTVESIVPIHLVGEGKTFAEKIVWFGESGKGGGYTLLPSDFLRLISFQMSDWSYPVNVAITMNHPKYAMQKSRYPGVRGCPQRPVVAIVPRAIGLTLEFYSCTSGDDAFVTRASYLPIPKIEEGKIEICERIYNAVVLQCAAMVCATVGNTQLAEYFNKQTELYTK